MPNIAEFSFIHGCRKEAVEKALAIVKANKRSASVIICKDIPGKHTGGEECFCSPLIIEVDENGNIRKGKR